MPLTPSEQNANDTDGQKVCPSFLEASQKSANTPSEDESVSSEERQRETNSPVFSIKQPPANNTWVRTTRTRDSSDPCWTKMLYKDGAWFDAAGNHRAPAYWQALDQQD